jgi:hypothetical protein
VFASPISGSSGGTFSNLGGCDKNGSDRECGIVGSSNGSNTQVRWPYLDHNDQIGYASSLTAVDVNINTSVSAQDVIIARLDWFNASTDDDITPDTLDVRWTLRISFSDPNVSIDSETFDLSITNTDNPSGDIISGLAGLNSLAFNLDGWKIDNFRYSVVDGDGHCQGTDTSFSGSSWFNCEDNTASLLITADITDTTQPASAVNEPATLALLGTGLFGLAVLRRRQTAKIRR